jgi:hypothetical protein
MIEEAEKAAVPESTVEERVAKGETYIDGQGKEVALEKNTVTLSEVIANPEKFQPAIIEKKSKPTLLSDLSPSEESFTEASIEVVAENITVPDSINPSNFEINFENTNSKKKTYMIKDPLGKIQIKSKE